MLSSRNFPYPSWKKYKKINYNFSNFKKKDVLFFLELFIFHSAINETRMEKIVRKLYISKLGHFYSYNLLNKNSDKNILRIWRKYFLFSHFFPSLSLTKNLKWKIKHWSLFHIFPGPSLPLHWLVRELAVLSVSLSSNWVLK